jgi:hypothetical protein
MISTFTALLEARDPALGRFRAYLLEAGTDLFGAWLVDVTYGRIGTRGRRIRYVVPDENEARKLVRENLRRRATAKRRIGVAYRFRSLTDPHQWYVGAAAEIENIPNTPILGVSPTRSETSFF